MSEQEPIILICMPLASAVVVARNSVTNQKCSECGQTVVMAPSGQRFRQEHPEAVILCALCYIPNQDETPQLAATSVELAEECRTAQPNIWRSRN